MYRRSICREACLRLFIHSLVQILSNVENLLRKKFLNLLAFCHEIKTSPKIKKLRHASCIVMCFNGPENFIHLYVILSEIGSQEKINLKNHVLIHHFTIQ